MKERLEAGSRLRPGNRSSGLRPVASRSASSAQRLILLDVLALRCSISSLVRREQHKPEVREARRSEGGPATSQQDTVTLVAVAKLLPAALASTIRPLAAAVAFVRAHSRRMIPEKARETSRRVMVVV